MPRAWIAAQPHSKLWEGGAETGVSLRFLCDEMLKRLGQWLRAAGYDVLMLPDGTADRELIRRARSERRILLTRDRHMASQGGDAALVVLLDCNDLDACVADLQQRLAIDWQYAPFTRCMNCNTPLVPADAAQSRQVPPPARAASERPRYCPRCRQLYWDGSHVARMRERLAAWQRAAGPDPRD
jgi:uncharacterized protein with PIN domain